MLTGRFVRRLRRLALLLPAAQSITADYYTQHRGRAFGTLHFTGAAGAVLSTLFATNIGGVRPLGFEGWRFAFVSVALASWCVGACTFFFAVDPRRSRDPQYRCGSTQRVLGCAGPAYVRAVQILIWLSRPAGAHATVGCGWAAAKLLAFERLLP